MPTVNLYLKDYNSKKKTAIRAVINDGRGVQYKVYSGISINPKHWSKAKKYVLSADPNAVTKNKHLEEFQDNLLDAYLSAKREGISVTTEYLKEKAWPKEENALSFWQVWDVFIESKRQQYRKQSFAKFRSLQKHLQEFEEIFKKPFSLQNIDEVILEDLQRFFYEVKELNTQSSQKYIGVFKIFLNWATQRKYTANADFRNFKPIRQPQTLKVVLTDEEIQKIESVELKDKNYLRNVRELLILSCLTGLRFGDYSKVQSQHYKVGNDGESYLLLMQNKSDGYVEVPLTSRAVEVVKSLISGEVHPVSNQKMNKYVKELCQIAGVDEPCEIHRFRGREKTVQVKPKYEMITSHIGRRTFATNLLLKGVAAEVVMQFTGHKDYKSFSEYVNIPKNAQKKLVKEALHSPQMKVAR